MACVTACLMMNNISNKRKESAAIESPLVTPTEDVSIELPLVSGHPLQVLSEAAALVRREEEQLKVEELDLSFPAENSIFLTRLNASNEPICVAWLTASQSLKQFPELVLPSDTLSFPGSYLEIESSDSLVIRRIKDDHVNLNGSWVPLRKARTLLPAKSHLFLAPLRNIFPDYVIAHYLPSQNTKKAKLSHDAPLVNYVDPKREIIPFTFIIKENSVKQNHFDKSEETEDECATESEGEGSLDN